MGGRGNCLPHRFTDLGAYAFSSLTQDFWQALPAAYFIPPFYSSGLACYR